jgi:amino acid transporter
MAAGLARTRPASRAAAQPGIAAPGQVSLTGRGAVLMMAAVFAAGLLVSSWLGVLWLAGLCFVLGAAAAARYTRASDLLTVAVTPPLVFFCALVVIKVLTDAGSLVLSVAGGSLLILGSLAPWLFAGVALCLFIAWRRGLAECVSALRRELRPGAPHHGPGHGVRL